MLLFVSPILLWNSCAPQSPRILFRHSHCSSHFQIHPTGNVQAHCRWGLEEYSRHWRKWQPYSQMIWSEYWFIRDRSRRTFHAAFWIRNPDPRSRFCLLVHSWWKSTCFVFRRLASNGSLPHWSVMFCLFFHGDFCLFWDILCCQRAHKLSGTEWHTSLRNRVKRRRMCKITGFPLCNPFKGLFWDSSKFHSILRYGKCLMF